MTTTDSENSGLRALPSVDKVLAEPALADLLGQFKRDLVVDAVRGQVAQARTIALAGGEVPTATDLAEAVADNGVESWRAWPTPVINATGVILHTNLGRAPLSEASLNASVAAAEGYSDLELELDDGRRGSRHSAVSLLLKQLIGSESAIAVNNNAGAMLLGLAAIAKGKEVIVSRGEASEIGGGFRIPDVLAQSDAKLVEVGTVNRTYAEDYEKAITPETAALLVVHRSNFQVIGFTHEAGLDEIVAVGKAHDIPVLHDLGSGALLDTANFGLTHEWMPQESLAAGAGLVFFSGDKLLGGPQAGIVVGTTDLVGRLSSHPLARALRADKLTLAALHATLLHYARDEARDVVPVWRMIGLSVDEITVRAGAMATALGVKAKVVPGNSAIGGGTLPTDELATMLVSIDPASVVGEAEELARHLRTGKPAVMARIEDEKVLLDLRTVPPSRDADLINVVKAALA